MQCKNCNNTFEGSFCNNCGQKADTHRLTIKHSIHDFFHSFVHVDTGLLYLIIQMAKRPGEVVKDYLAGKRRSYFNPTQYLILTVAAATFLSINFTLMGDTAGTVSPEKLKQLPEMQQIFLQFNKFIYKYFNIVLFLSVPLMALFTRLFYRSSGHNYAENLTLMCFLGGQRTLFYICLAPFLYFLRTYWFVFIGLYYLGWIVYYGWAFTEFFKGKKSTIIIKFIIIILIFLPLTQALSWGIFFLFFYKPL